MLEIQKTQNQNPTTQYLSTSISPGSLGEIMIDDCDYLSLSARTDFQAWLNQLITYTAARVGRSPKLRMYAYEHGAQTIVALDIFGDNPSNDMTITILVSPGSAMLSGPVDDQLDIALPSLASVIDFAGHLANCHQGYSPQTRHLEILPWAERPEAQHALMS